MPDANAVTSALAQIHHIPAFVFGHFKYVTTNSMASASALVANTQANYPVLLFLGGLSTESPPILAVSARAAVRALRASR